MDYLFKEEITAIDAAPLADTLKETNMSADKRWDFKEQLQLGDRGEQLFLERYPRKLEIFPGREYDFTVKSSREKLELKTDSYNMDKSDNFFFERFSDVARETPGGPWRAAKDSVDIFCYYFVRHNLWFEFRDLPALTKKLDEMTKKQGLVYIKNRGWTTAGYKVNRESLSEFYSVWQFDPTKD